MGENFPPLRAISFAELTPQRAKEMVAKLEPSVRAGLVERVREALQHHQQEGEADAARFCIMMLDALRNAEAVATVGDT